MKLILMLLDNEFAPDLRVKKEIDTLNESGFDIDLFCWDREGKLKSKELSHNFNIFRITTIAKRQLGYRQIVNLFRFYYFLYKAVANNCKQYSVIHAHDLRTLFVGIIFKYRLKIPLVYDAHEIFSLMESHKFSRFLLRIIEQIEIFAVNQFVDKFITVSEQRKKAYWKKNGIRQKIHIVGNWYNPVSSYTLMEKKKIKSKLGIPDGKPIMAYLGSVHAGRDIESFCKYLEKEPSIHGIIAGNGSEVSIQKVKKYSEKNENISYLGFITDPDSIYQISDILVYLVDSTHNYSYWIAPNNLFIAIAHRKPLIAINRGEVSEIFSDHSIGSLVSDYSYNSLKEGVENIFKLDNLREIEENLKLCQKDYTWSNSEKELNVLYSELF
jgi:glycosyltransferase involved in cell wall biosynthesis